MYEKRTIRVFILMTRIENIYSTSLVYDAYFSTRFFSCKQKGENMFYQVYKNTNLIIILRVLLSESETFYIFLSNSH